MRDTRQQACRKHNCPVSSVETIVDPVAAALHNAEVDDEPESEAEKSAVAEARSSGTVPHEEALRGFGW